MDDVTLDEAVALLAEKGKTLKPRGAAGRKGKAPAKSAALVAARKPAAPAVKKAAPKKAAAPKAGAKKAPAAKKKAAGKRTATPKRAAE
jgi:DNA topoisomerase-1